MLMKRGPVVTSSHVAVGNKKDKKAPWADRLDGWEGKGKAAADWFAKPRVYTTLVIVLILAGILVRVPVAFEEDQHFLSHADEATYFNKAFTEYRSGGDKTALHHGGSGLPLVLNGLFKMFGHGPGAPVCQANNPDGDGSCTPLNTLELDQRSAARLAYAFNALLGAGMVVATYFLARKLLPPTGVLGAMLFVAFDPFTLSDRGVALLTEGAYTAAFVFSLAAVFKAKEHPAWLLAIAPLMAFASMLRVNGLVMLVMLLVFAGLYLRRASDRFQWRYVAIAFGLTFVLLSPYLAFRAGTPCVDGPFDYGTNDRKFADHPWRTSPPDEYWQTYCQPGGAREETMADYFATHSFGDAWDRMFNSVAWQIQDFLGPGFADGASALTPWLAGLFLVGMFTHVRDREWWFMPLAVGFTMATFVWIYPVVQSVRYFMPLIPLVAVFAMPGLSWLGAQAKRPAMALWAFWLVWAFLYVIPGIERIFSGLGDLFTVQSDVLLLTLLMTVFWLAVAFGGDLVGRFTRRGAEA